VGGRKEAVVTFGKQIEAEVDTIRICACITYAFLSGFINHFVNGKLISTIYLLEVL